MRKSNTNKKESTGPIENKIKMGKSILNKEESADPILVEVAAPSITNPILVEVAAAPTIASLIKENGTAISAIITGLSAWMYGQKELGIAGIVMGVGSIVTKYLAKFLGNIK